MSQSIVSENDLLRAQLSVMQQVCGALTQKTVPRLAALVARALVQREKKQLVELISSKEESHAQIEMLEAQLNVLPTQPPYVARTHNPSPPRFTHAQLSARLRRRLQLRVPVPVPVSAPLQ